MGNCFNFCNTTSNLSGSTSGSTSMLSDLSKATNKVEKYSLNGMKMWGKVVYCYDGDTVHIVLPQHNTMIRFICRLNGIDTPEIATKDNKEKEAGIKSRNYLFSLVTNKKIENEISKKDIGELCGESNKLIWVHCFDFDKYGRLLVDLYHNPNDIKSINTYMIENKFAVPYDGGTKLPKEEFSLILQ
jgi:endonuclease YncB( thermonuclease family)